MKVSRFVLTAALAALVNGPQAFAHIGWSGDRDFNTLVPYVTETSASRTVGGNFGWADATDANWGDSHRGAFFRFSLTETTTVQISAARRDVGTQTGSSNTLLPAFSLYTVAGSPTSGTLHDSSPNTVGYLTGLFGTGVAAETYTDSNSNGFWNVGEPFVDTNANGILDKVSLGGSGKEGAVNALGDWTIYSDAGAFATFAYVGNVADGTSANFGDAAGINGDGSADGYVSATFADLAPGQYFIWVAGANYAAQMTDDESYGPLSNAYPTYGITVGVTAIPEPSTFTCAAGLAALGLVTLRRRRR
jgi:PEP-CTERM motif